MGRFQHGVRLAMLVGTLLGVALSFGCSDDAGSGGGGAAKPASTPTTPALPPPPEKPAEPVVDTRTPEELALAGRSVYMANCIACHNMNPSQDGALGPAVAGASPALLEARVLRGEYPQGYEPKRPSRVMIPLPYLEPRLSELAAYLGSLE